MTRMWLKVWSMTPASAHGREETPFDKALVGHFVFLTIHVCLCSQPNRPLHYYCAIRYTREKLCLFRESHIFRLFKMRRVCFKACKHNEVGNQELQSLYCSYLQHGFLLHFVLTVPWGTKWACHGEWKKQLCGRCIG